MAIDSWLRHQSQHSLERLFSTRCLMNFGGLYLTDIDALGITEDNELELIEFKRKDPTRGVQYTPLPIVDSWAQIHEFLARADFHACKNEKRLEELRNDGRWNEELIPSFGLDGSHVRTLRLCIAAGIRYQYVIWHSSIKSLSNLLSADFKPLVDVHLQTRYMTENCFIGVSWTTGEDSGEYSDKIRFQGMTPLSAFTSATILRKAFVGAPQTLE